jgi:predicted ABC-type ATPase
MPELLLMGGPNGAGKTTFARELLTHELKGLRFLNNDEIARGLSPFDPAPFTRKATRILLGGVR